MVGLEPTTLAGCLSGLRRSYPTELHALMFNTHTCSNHLCSWCVFGLCGVGGLLFTATGCIHSIKSTAPDHTFPALTVLPAKAGVYNLAPVCEALHSVIPLGVFTVVISPSVGVRT